MRDGRPKGRPWLTCDLPSQRDDGSIGANARSSVAAAHHRRARPGMPGWPEAPGAHVDADDDELAAGERLRLTLHARPVGAEELGDVLDRDRRGEGGDREREEHDDERGDSQESHAARDSSKHEQPHHSQSGRWRSRRQRHRPQSADLRPRVRSADTLRGFDSRRLRETASLSRSSRDTFRVIGRRPALRTPRSASGLEPRLRKA